MSKNRDKQEIAEAQLFIKDFSKFIEENPEQYQKIINSPILREKIFNSSQKLINDPEKVKWYAKNVGHGHDLESITIGLQKLHYNTQVPLIGDNSITNPLEEDTYF